MHTFCRAAVDRRSLPLALSLVALRVGIGVGSFTAIDGRADDAPAEDAGAPQLLQQVDGFPDWVTSVAITPGGESIAAGSFEVVKLLTQTGEQRAEWKPGAGFVRALAFSPDDQLLLAGSHKDISVWDVAENEGAPREVGRLQGHRGYVDDLAFSPDGTRLASCGEDGTVRLWDWQQRTQLALSAGDGTPVRSVAFSPDAKLLAIALGDESRLSQPGHCRLLDATTLDIVRELPQHKRAATAVAWTTDGQFVLTAAVDERIHVVDPATGVAHGFFGAHTRPINCLAVTGENRVAISGSGGRFQGKNDVRFWHPEEGTEWASIEPHAGRVNDLAVSSARGLLVTGSQDKTVALFDIRGVLAAAGVPLAEPAEGAGIGDDAPTGKRPEPRPLRAGIIGLDTSHVIGFTKLLNAAHPLPEHANCRVVAAYPQGSVDIESSTSRIPQYTAEIQALGVTIVDSIPALLEQVDVVLLETNDGRPHLEQVLPVLQAGKRVFVDKPIAGSLTEAIVILRAAERYNVPLMSSSVMRFFPDMQDVRGGAIGEVTGCDAYSPCTVEPTHPDLFWYGIHGVETLFTVMGPGCQSVTRASTEDFDLVVGRWDQGRLGTFRGIRRGKRAFGGTAYGTQGTRVLVREGGYERLVAAIVTFFQTGEAPVSHDETLAIYAFMEAADESRRRGGADVPLQDVLIPARQAAEEKLKSLFDGVTAGDNDTIERTDR